MRLLPAAAVGLLSLAPLALCTAPANAADDATATALQACGAGYNLLQASRPFDGAVFFAVDGPQGVCAVTVKTRDVGVRSEVGVHLNRQEDRGYYESYAGPVYEQLPHGTRVPGDGWDKYATSGSVWVYWS